VFPSAVGTRQDRNRVRGRVFANAITEANKRLAGDGLSALPQGLTLHALRRTFASVLPAIGKDHPYVMKQMGHTDPTVTYGICAQVMATSDEDRARLRQLVGESALRLVPASDYLAVAGSSDEKRVAAEG
jgi:integrase